MCSDVFRPDVSPASAAVVRTINAVAVTDASLAVVFARADPDGRRIFGIESDRTDRKRAFVVKNRRPCRAVVNRFPNAAGCDRDVILGAVRRINGKRVHASRRNRRADRAKPQAAKTPTSPSDRGSVSGLAEVSASGWRSARVPALMLRSRPESATATQSRKASAFERSIRQMIVVVSKQGQRSDANVARVVTPSKLINCKADGRNYDFVRADYQAPGR